MITQFKIFEQSSEVDLFDLDSVLKYINYDVNMTDSYGQNVLFKIIIDIKSSGDEQLAIDIFDYLIENGIDVNCVDDGGETPLTMAYIYNRWLIFDFLLENGADMKKNTYDILMKASEIDTLNNIIKLLEFDIEWTPGFFENLKSAEQEVIKEKFPEKYKEYIKNKRIKQFNI